MKNLLKIAAFSFFALTLFWSPEIKADAEFNFGKSIVVVFSQTGNTIKLADIIAAKTGAEIYRIEPTVPFPADEKEIIAAEERRRSEGKTLEFKPPLPDFNSYNMIFLGSPVWFGEPPDLVSLWLSQADFKGKPVAIFATAGTQPREIIHSLASKVQNGSPLTPGFIQKRADDHTEAVVLEQISNWLTEIKAAAAAQ
jgi:flavodoxin